MSLTVRVDLDRCIGSANCVLELPEAFEIGASGQAEVLPGAHGLDDERLRDIAWRCPTSAIRLSDASGHEIDALA